MKLYSCIKQIKNEQKYVPFCILLWMLYRSLPLSPCLQFVYGMRYLSAWSALCGQSGDKYMCCIWVNNAMTENWLRNFYNNNTGKKVSKKQSIENESNFWNCNGSWWKRTHLATVLAFREKNMIWIKTENGQVAAHSDSNRRNSGNGPLIVSYLKKSVCINLCECACFFFKRKLIIRQCPSVVFLFSLSLSLSLSLFV